MRKVARVLLTISLAFIGITTLGMLVDLTRRCRPDVSLVGARLELLGLMLAIYSVLALPGFLLSRRQGVAPRLVCLMLASVVAVLSALSAVMVTFTLGMPC